MMMPTTIRNGSMRKRVFALLLVISSASALAAQTERRIIPVDLGSGVIAGTLPFDEPFILTTPANKSFRAVRLWVGEETVLPRADCALLQPRPDTDPQGSTKRPDPKRAHTEYLDAQKLLGDATKVRVETLEVRKRDTQKAREAADKDTPKVGREPTQTQTVLQKAQETAQAKEALAVAELRRARASLAGLRENLQLTSAWSNAKLDSNVAAAMDVGPIEPNRNYTFCFHVIREPTKDETAEFAKKAQAALLKVIRSFHGTPLDTVAQLEEMQLALFEALPPADSIELASASAILKPAPPGETEVEKRTRLNALAVLYNGHRGSYATIEENIKTAKDQAKNTLSREIQVLLGDARTLRMLGAIDDSVLVRAGGASYVSAAALARRLAFLNINVKVREDLSNYIASGALSIDSLALFTAGRTLTPISTIAEVSTFDQRLLRTSGQLEGLLSLAEFKLSHLDSTTAEAQSVAALIQHIGAVREELKNQRHTLSLIVAALQSSEENLTKFVASIATLDFARISLRATSSTTYSARANMYLSLDAGLLSAFTLREVVPYLGINLYFVPVNKNMPVKGCHCILRRTSLTIGVTAASIKQEKRIDDLFNSHAIFAGVGYRVTDFWRFSAGLLVAKTYTDGTSNPGRVNVVYPTYATSIDIDVINLLGKFGSLLIPNLK